MFLLFIPRLGNYYPSRVLLNHAVYKLVKNKDTAPAPPHAVASFYLNPHSSSNKWNFNISLLFHFNGYKCIFHGNPFGRKIISNRMLIGQRTRSRAKF